MNDGKANSSRASRSSSNEVDWPSDFNDFQSCPDFFDEPATTAQQRHVQRGRVVASPSEARQKKSRAWSRCEFRCNTSRCACFVVSALSVAVAAVVASLPHARKTGQLAPSEERVDALTPTLAPSKDGVDALTPTSPPPVQASCYNNNEFAGYTRVCLEFTTTYSGESYTLGILGYIPEDHSPYTNGPHASDVKPISLFSMGSGKNLLDMTAQRFPLEMAMRGYCGFVVQYLRSDLIQYCDGDFDVKAGHTYNRTHGALSVIEANLPQCSATYGLAASGFSQGGHLALLSRLHNPYVTGILVISSGHTSVSLCYLPLLFGDCAARAMADLLQYSGHSSFSPQTMVRSVIGARDDVFGNGINCGGGVKEQQRELTGIMDSECVSSYNCLQSGGYGYYIIQSFENNNVVGHTIYEAGANRFTDAWVGATAAPFMWASFNWLSQKASSSGQVLATPTGHF